MKWNRTSMAPTSQVGFYNEVVYLRWPPLRIRLLLAETLLRSLQSSQGWDHGSVNGVRCDVEICSEEMGWTEPMICSILHGHVYGCNAQSALRSLGNFQIKDGRVQKSSRKPSGNFCVLTSLFSKLTNTLARWQADITDFWENSVPRCGLIKSRRLLKVTDLLPRQEYQCPATTHDPLLSWELPETSLIMTQRWMRWSTGKWNKKKKTSLKVATMC